MNLYSLTPFDLALAAGLVLALGVIQVLLGLGLFRSLAVNSVRMVLQLLLVGVILEAVFDAATLPWIALIAVVMMGLAGYEVVARQKRAIRGWHGYGIGLAAMSATALIVTVLALSFMIDADPWYTPQYAIPLLGMILGNTMTGIGLALNNLTQTAWQSRREIEARLVLGHSVREATAELRSDSMRAGLIPTLNMLAAAGVISLPGMMTGQILAGSPPIEAVKYQILIMFLIAAATGFGSLIAVQLGARRLFDGRDRLRLDRLRR
ncbi:MAG: iron export ABC transporter permease subunit FetB [Halothiobacillaceae bacterium]|nr:iron export ABC transporter permease subunit FetB [Halothiobacillaceae bacterium]HER34315.1 iron export ABC transporter permease subunit FetB [Halothiobacillaceae bacterium]